MARLKAGENSAGLEKSLLSVFEAALLPLGPIDEGRRTPEAAAAQIDQLCPSLEAPEALELFIWTLWELSLTVVRAAPYDDPALERMVAILESLRLRARGTVSLWGMEYRLWRDLPLLDACIREAWVDPVQVVEDLDDEVPNADIWAEWISLNAFTARLMNNGVVRWTVLAVIEIGAALEHDIVDTYVRDSRLVVVQQWIMLSGKEIFKDAFQANKLDETEIRATNPGPLYTGPPGLVMQRWRFWMKRLEELGEGAKGKVGLQARDAAAHMKDITEKDGRAIARRLGDIEEPQAEAETETKQA
ncbi:hypothetical protein SAPIO_CDS6048 [Scedosporium apiospermum]|uniref:Uncharacterized protein n=1 Tax=Pseudallescheria apiosperma TaxID=563466 RepID=A0A084G5Z9_PSEDA|nr:uncharacterized protein SAPIO_CDS6048 [Scedosporium apiospermum]KEZ42761.1 hypothetical protein SAPIO_CDS6048 [Scedosporium apiospermum]